jgi:hypothetical protein
MAKSLFFFFFFNRNLFRRFSATVGCAIAARRTKKSQDLNQSNFYRGTTRHIIQIEMETFQHFYQSRMNFWDVENLQNPAKKDFADSYCCATSTKRSYGIWSNLCVITLGRETVLYIYYTLRETGKLRRSQIGSVFILFWRFIAFPFSLLWVYVALAAAATTNSVDLWMCRLYILHWRSRFHFYCNTFHSIHFRLSSFLSCLLLHCPPQQSASFLWQIFKCCSWLPLVCRF